MVRSVAVAFVVLLFNVCVSSEAQALNILGSIKSTLTGKQNSNSAENQAKQLQSEAEKKEEQERLNMAGSVLLNQVREAYQQEEDKKAAMLEEQKKRELEERVTTSASDLIGPAG